MKFVAVILLQKPGEFFSSLTILMNVVCDLRWKQKPVLICKTKFN